MTISDTSLQFFSVYKHFSIPERNCLEYGLKFLPHEKDEFNRYRKFNEFPIRKYSKYSRQNIFLLAIINQFILNSGNTVNMELESYLSGFSEDIRLYKQNIKEDYKYLYTKISSIEDIVSEYRSKKIKWFTFYYLMRYLKYDKSVISLSIVNSLKKCYKTTLFFPFDEEFMKKSVGIIQKKLDLVSI